MAEVHGRVNTLEISGRKDSETMAATLYSTGVGIMGRKTY